MYTGLWWTIYNNSEDYDHEAFVLPSYVAKLIKEGKLSRKTGEGLFKTVEVDKEQKDTWYMI